MLCLIIRSVKILGVIILCIWTKKIKKLYPYHSVSAEVVGLLMLNECKSFITKKYFELAPWQCKAPIAVPESTLVKADGY